MDASEQAYEQPSRSVQVDISNIFFLKFIYQLTISGNDQYFD